jgi:hypothetical protein
MKGMPLFHALPDTAPRALAVLTRRVTYAYRCIAFISVFLFWNFSRTYAEEGVIVKNSILLALFLFSIPVLANSAGQTDWSGGPGVPGPVGPWGNAFSTGTNVDYDTTPGILSLAEPYGPHLVGYQTTNPNSSTLGDFNGDGLLDIAAVTNEGVFWWKNDGISGFTWTRYSISDTADSRSWIMSCDFDKDGDVDVAASLYGNGLYWWEKNSSSETDWTQHVIQTGDTRECCLGDFDNDGWTDIGLTVVSTADVLWWRNKLGSTHNWTVNYVDGGLDGAYTIDALQMNGTGGVDIVAGSYSTGKIVMYVNNLGSWDRRVVAPTGSHLVRRVRIANIDGNDRFDIVAATDDELVWWENVNWNYWTLHTIVDGYNPNSIGIADLNNDGHADVLSGDFGYGSNGELRWYQNNGTGSSWELIDSFLSSNSYDLSVGDINNDGIPDAVTTSTSPVSTIQQYRFGGYNSPGELLSSIYDTGASDDINWDYLHWDSVEPSGTDLRVAIRGSADAGNMGAWSGWLSAPTILSGLLFPTDRYIQYKLELTTTSSWITPHLNDITFLWGIPGFEEGSGQAQPLVLNGSNPASGSFQLSFSLPVSGNAELAVFDLSGRQVATPVSGYFEVGTHSTLISGLPSGIYVCIYSAPEVSASLQVTVVH